MGDSHLSGPLLITGSSSGTKAATRVNAPDSNLEFAGLGEVRVQDKLITTAQVLALFATPIEVVAAPGANIALQFLGAHVLLDFNSAAYVDDADEDLVFKYTNAAGKTISQEIDGSLLDDGADMLAFVGPAGTDPIVAAEVANAAIVVHVLTGELITGDSPLKIRLYYRQVRVVSLEAIV